SAPPVPTRSFALNSLLFLAVMVILKLAKPLMVTLALSLFFYFLLIPLVTFLARYRVPRPLAAGAIVTLLLATLTAGVIYAAAPATSWMEYIPDLIPSLREEMLPVSEPIAKIEEAATEVENIASPGDSTQPEVAVADGGVVNDMLAHAATILVSTGVVFFLTFFFLTFG